MLDLVNVTKVYKEDRRRHVALDSINIGINQGEFVAYLGPNGAGKSTTIKLVTGIIQPSSGRVEILNLNPFENRKYLSYKMGVMFGNRSALWPELTIIDTLTLLSKVYKIPKSKYLNRIEYLINELDLEKIVNKPVRTLSLGQKMLGELAVSVLHNPMILLLDEPTIGLDVLVKERVGKFLEKINKEEKVTIMMASHDLTEVSKLCKRLIIINEGKLLFNGSQEEIGQLTDNRLTLTINHEISNSEIKIDGMQIVQSSDVNKTVSIDLARVSLNESINHLNTLFEIKHLDVDKPGLADLMISILRRKGG